eukprot:403352871
MKLSGKFFKTKVKQAIKSQDMFGHKIGLTYKNKSSYKTSFGGIITILFRLGIIIYLAMQLIDVYNRKFELKLSTQYRNLYHDQTQYKFDNGGFDIAVGEVVTQWINVEGQPSFQNTTTTDFDLKICTSDRFASMSEASILGIYGGFYCAQNFNSSWLQGAKYSQKMKFQSIKVDKCNQRLLTQKNATALCASESEIQDVINAATVQIGVMNQIFNADNFKDYPLVPKILVETFNIQSAVAQRAVYVLKRNEAILKDNWIFASWGSQNFTSYETSLRSMSFPQANTDNTVFTFILGMNDQITITERKVFTLLDALSSTGGLLQFMIIALAFLTRNVQQNMFYLSVIKKIFLFDESHFSGKKESVSKDSYKTTRQKSNSNQGDQNENCTPDKLSKVKLFSWQQSPSREQPLSKNQSVNYKSNSIEN